MLDANTVRNVNLASHCTVQNEECLKIVYEYTFHCNSIWGNRCIQLCWKNQKLMNISMKVNGGNQTLLEESNALTISMKVKCCNPTLLEKK